MRGGWFPIYLWDSLKRNRVPAHVAIDVIVFVVDHFEPTRRFGDVAAVESVRTWCEKYKSQVHDIHDSNGRRPQHTWFYRAEYPNLGCIEELGRHCFEGYGEVEFHLHHGHDTPETFFNKLEQGLDFFNHHGAMLTLEASPQRRFAYIAGNWSLDNGSYDNSKSGCNTELIVLRDAGCYCDFTFPALGSKAQPRTTNSIYYATDDPRPKSYNSGSAVRVGGTESGDLPIFQGPCGFDWRSCWFEDAAIESYSPPIRKRMRAWIEPNIHVHGRPEWVFIKLHCHGMQSRDLWCGPQIRNLFQWMKEDWNQGRYRLHFVNAREAFNIVKAAERGETGNPIDYVDYKVPPPANRRIHCTSSWKLLEYSKASMRILLTSPTRMQLRIAGLGFDMIEGTMKQVELKRKGPNFTDIKILADSVVTASRGKSQLELPIGHWHRIDCCALR